MLIEQLVNLPSKGIRTIICDDPTALLHDIEVSELTSSHAQKIAVCRFETVPMLETILDRMVSALAEIALALFPNWYDGCMKETDLKMDQLESFLTGPYVIDRVVKCYPKSSSVWLQAASGCCREGKFPLPRKFSNETTTLQLAMAIGAENLTFLLSIEDQNPLPENLVGLVKASEWFIRITELPLLLLVPKGISAFKELEGVLYDSVAFKSEEAILGTEPESRENEKKYAYWPIQGNPHPMSPGEQLLARKLSHNTDLGSLFSFNQSVETVRDNRFMVDLLWPEGKVIVEVDGFGIHSNRLAFRQDRNRDYELMISGYLVLRLTHGEVMRDIEMAVDKIRDVVNFRKINPTMDTGNK